MDSSTAKLIGIAIGVVGAAAFAIASFFKDDEPVYMVSGQGPVQTQYVPPQYQAPQYRTPVYPAPQPQPYVRPIPAPQPVQPYQSQYPWGFYGYIDAIANTPVAPDYVPYQFNPVYTNQAYATNYGAYSVKGPEWNTNYQRVNDVGGYVIRPSPNAPPGYVQPQSVYRPTVLEVSPEMDAYVRTYENGAVSFAKIPSCYANDGSWRG